MRNLIFVLVLILLSIPILGQIKLPVLKFKQRTLSNGLRVISLRDNSSPTVSIHVLYRVGSKDDPEGRSGFAHLFEHMMFKSTKNMKSEMLDRLTEDVGGYNNASTWDDFTNYFEVVPSNYLETLLWAEAERMVNLNVDEQNFRSERDVVKEEFRQRILAQPYGRLFGQYIDELSFTVHPYKRPGAGNLEELDAATLDDVRNFYRTFYRPDNAVLIVVGDFEQEKLDFWIDKYFGKLKKPEEEVPRVKVVEPERTKEQRYVKTAPNVPFPAVAITYLAPPSKSKDVPALKLAEVILSQGESSRLFQSLVYKQQIAQEAGFNVDIRVDKGLLYFYAIASEGKTAEKLEKALLEELRKIQQKGVSARELRKAKNQLISSFLEEIETNDGKASAIERAVAFYDDPNAVNEEIKKIEAVTLADIKNVMNKYFAETNRVVIYYLQEGENTLD